jgi:hypothetical protein
MLLTLKRTLRVSSAVAAWIFLNVGFAYLAHFLDVPDSPYVDDGTVQSVFTLIFLGANLLIPIFLIYYRHRRRDLWIKEEAGRWLAQRSAPGAERARLRRRRLRHVVLWIPSVLALLVLLFLPESIGITSHLFYGYSFALARHKITLPLTAYVATYRNQYVTAFIGHGIGRAGLVPHLYSSLFFYAEPNPSNGWRKRDLARGNIVVAREPSFGSETLTCYFVSKTTESDPIKIECLASQNDLYGEFYGLRMDLPMFYKVLEDATETK